MKLKIGIVAAALIAVIVVWVLTRNDIDLLGQLSQAQILIAAALGGIFTLASVAASIYFTQQIEERRTEEERRSLRDALMVTVAAEIQVANVNYIVACKRFDEYLKVHEDYAERALPLYRRQWELYKDISNRTHSSLGTAKLPEVPTVQPAWYPTVTIHLYERVMENLIRLDSQVVADVLTAYGNLMENNRRAQESLPVSLIVDNRETLKETLYLQTISQIRLLKWLSQESSYVLPDYSADAEEMIQEWLTQKANEE